MGGRSGQNLRTQKSRQNLAKIVNESINKADAEGRKDRDIYFDPEAVGSRSRSIDELKKNAGQFIYTDLLYGKPNARMPRAGWDNIRDLGAAKLEELQNKASPKSVKINDINIQQNFVFQKPLMEKMKQAPKYVKVTLYEYDGKLYLNDGNHRVAAAFLNGNKTIKAKIINVDD